MNSASAILFVNLIDLHKALSKISWPAYIFSLVAPALLCMNDTHFEMGETSRHLTMRVNDVNYLSLAEILCWSSVKR